MLTVHVACLYVAAALLLSDAIPDAAHCGRLTDNNHLQRKEGVVVCVGCGSSATVVWSVISTTIGGHAEGGTSGLEDVLFP